MPETAVGPPEPRSAPRGPRIGRGGPQEPPARVTVIRELTAPVAPVEPYLGIKALSAYSGLSPRTLRGLLKHPEHPLPHYRIGGRVLVRRSEYDLWAARYRRVGDVDLDRVVTEALRDLRGAA